MTSLTKSTMASVSSSSSSSSAAAAVSVPASAASAASTGLKRKKESTPLTEIELLMRKQQQQKDLTPAELQQIADYSNKFPEQAKQSIRKLGSLKAAAKRKRNQKPAKEIKKYQASTKRLLPQLPLHSDIREQYKTEIFPSLPLTDDVNDVRFAKKGLHVFQDEREARIVRHLALADEMRLLRGREQVEVCDINAASLALGYETKHEIEERMTRLAHQEALDKAEEDKRKALKGLAATAAASSAVQSASKPPAKPKAPKTPKTKKLIVKKAKSGGTTAAKAVKA